MSEKKGGVSPSEVKSNRRKERARVKKATKEAQTKWKKMEGIPLELKKTAMDDYMGWRQKSDPEVIQQVRDDLEHQTYACNWCLKFLEAGYNHCIHCGKLFKDTLLKDPPLPRDPSPPSFVCWINEEIYNDLKR